MENVTKVSNLEKLGGNSNYVVLFFYNPKTANLKEEDIEYDFEEGGADEELADEVLFLGDHCYMRGSMPAVAVQKDLIPFSNSPRQFYEDDADLAVLKDHPDVEQVVFDFESDGDRMAVSSGDLEDFYISGSFAVIEV